MNTRVKGRNSEKEYAQILTNEGCLVEIVKGSTKFNKSVDFFGVADLIVLDKANIKLIQVKSNSTSGAVKKLKEWYLSNKSKLPPNLILEVAVRKDGKSLIDRWRVIKIN
jgi:Holliday junction resolvase